MYGWREQLNRYYFDPYSFRNATIYLATADDARQFVDGLPESVKLTARVSQFMYRGQLTFAVRIDG